MFLEKHMTNKIVSHNMTLRIKNWESFQHYKDRSPPWIKLHKSLLDNYEYQCLPVASKAIAPMLWLLASEDVEGAISGDFKEIAFRLRMTVSEVETALRPLVGKGFVVMDSTVLAECKQHDTPETETETETENYISPSAQFAEFWAKYPPSKRKAAKTKCAEVWKRRKLDKVANTIFAHLESVDEDYRKESCRYCPAPLAYLNGEKWDGFSAEAAYDPFEGAI
jgi:hypothetical protein